MKYTISCKFCLKFQRKGFTVIFPMGPFINAVCVFIASLIGISIGKMLPERVRTIVFQGLGLCTLVIGMKMAIATNALLVIILSILIGGILGELFNLEEKFLSIGTFLKNKIGSNNPKFTEGLVNASVLFCIGAMAIIGSVEEGINGDKTIVITKTIMDFFASIALASVYGIGVGFSALTIFIYQGLLVIFSSQLQGMISPELLVELSALGGVLILGISLNLLNLLQIKLSNFLPSLILLPILYPLYLLLGL